MSKLRFEIDAPLMQSRIDELGRCGEESGVLFRPAYSPAWLEARDLLASWMSAAGLETRVDEAGNLFGRLDGRTDGPVVLCGSHLDTVRNGGKYDGALGIHAGLAALSAIVDSGAVPHRPIEVVALCEEEGSRFTSIMWGTQAILGQTSAADLDELVDEDGVTIREAMRSVGLPGEGLERAARSDIGAFIELHIEQGGILEGVGSAVGVVDAIAGTRQFRVRVHGQQNHAGTTPMDLRTDALAGSAEMILSAERVAREAGRPAVATVGQISVEPGARNVVPGTVEFTVDIRHPDDGSLEKLRSEIAASVESVANARRLSATVEEIFYRAPVPMDARIVDTMSRLAREKGLSFERMPSGAGHDSQLFALEVPTAMIFTPSVGEISHSPLEFTPMEMIEPGTDLLATLLWELASDADASDQSGPAPE